MDTPPCDTHNTRIGSASLPALCVWSFVGLGVEHKFGLGVELGQGLGHGLGLEVQGLGVESGVAGDTGITLLGV